ncbi:MAG TPA: hypothetical protein DCE71_04180, partial [Parachlamydiales bacterium]|nr:hypothetical protein [Parachlamydiales bacterium]
MKLPSLRKFSPDLPLSFIKNNKDSKGRSPLAEFGTEHTSKKNRQTSALDLEKFSPHLSLSFPKKQQGFQRTKSFGG